MTTFCGETVVHNTKRYQLTRDRIGHYILRRYKTRGGQDGRTVYFQGDDARLWDRNLRAMDEIEAKNGWRAGNSYDNSFDFLCESYNDMFDN